LRSARNSAVLNQEVNAMSEQITIDREKLYKVLAAFGGRGSGRALDADDGIPGTVPVTGPGGPVMRYAQVAARHFIAVVVASEQMNAVHKGEFNAKASKALVRKFVQDFRVHPWSDRMVLPFPWPPYPPFPTVPPIPFPWPPFPFPWPPPPPPPGPGPDPIDYVLVGLEFYEAAQALAGTEFHELFMDSANQLLEVGLSSEK
jgi:hypothetical protein